MNGTAGRDRKYDRLRQLLSDKHWKAANEETMLRLLEASGRIEFLIEQENLSYEGMTVLFQLFDTSGRLKMLEALARSRQLVKANMKLLDELKELFNLLDRAEEFYLSVAIDESEQLTSEHKTLLHQVFKLLNPDRTNSAQRSVLYKKLVLGWKEQNWHLLREDIELCPCRDLRTIDDIWSVFSQKKFGFSRQAYLWEKIACRNIETFGDIVGWRRNNTWIDYQSVIFVSKLTANFSSENLQSRAPVLVPSRVLTSQVATAESTFSIENAPYGHLPVFPRIGWWAGFVQGTEAVIDRLNHCHFPPLGEDN